MLLTAFFLKQILGFAASLFEMVEKLDKIFRYLLIIRKIQNKVRTLASVSKFVNSFRGAISFPLTLQPIRQRNRSIKLPHLSTIKYYLKIS